MIKPLQKTTCSIQRSLPSASLHAHPTTRPPVPAASVALVGDLVSLAPDTATVSDHSGSTPNHWQAYAQGGVKADDELARVKSRKNAAKFQELISNGSSSSSALAPGKLIQVSPKKRYSNILSTNTNLLVDLTDDVPPIPAPSTPGKNGRISYREKFSYFGDITSPISSKEDTQPTDQVPEQGVLAPVFDLLD